jgi:hypothetical protein
MVARAALDSAPPPPPPAPPAYVYAATDERPRTPEEQKLCAKASDPDWLYLGAGVVLTAGAIALDTWAHNQPEGVRYLGPSAVGLTWGFLLGGGFLALPKCSPDYVTSAPPEGNVRTDLEVALIFAALAGLTAPVIVAVETGPGPQNGYGGSPGAATYQPPWSNTERVMHLVLASGFGIVGALLPYLVPPTTWRAAKQLEHLRASPTEDGRGAFVSWGVRF